MTEETETVTTYRCDLCKDSIEDYSKDYNHFDEHDICDECKTKLWLWLHSLGSYDEPKTIVGTSEVKKKGRHQ